MSVNSGRRTNDQTPSSGGRYNWREFIRNLTPAQDRELRRSIGGSGSQRPIVRVTREMREAREARRQGGRALWSPPLSREDMYLDGVIPSQPDAGDRVHHKCIITAEPRRHGGEEASIKYDFPAWMDFEKGEPTYSWEGLTFPRPRVVIAVDSDKLVYDTKETATSAMSAGVGAAAGSCPTSSSNGAAATTVPAEGRHGEPTLRTDNADICHVNRLRPRWSGWDRWRFPACARKAAPAPRGERCLCLAAAWRCPPCPPLGPPSSTPRICPCSTQRIRSPRIPARTHTSARNCRWSVAPGTQKSGGVSGGIRRFGGSIFARQCTRTVGEGLVIDAGTPGLDEVVSHELSSLEWVLAHKYATARMAAARSVRKKKRRIEGRMDHICPPNGGHPPETLGLMAYEGHKNSTSAFSPPWSGADAIRRSKGHVLILVSEESEKWARAISIAGLGSTTTVLVLVFVVLPHPMAPQFSKVLLPVDEMLPDNRTPGRDPRFWCLPPMRDEPNLRVPRSQYAFYLVTRGRMVGVWRRWSVAQLMVTGFPDAGHKGHDSYESCTAEWQEHCQMGVHPHPADPSLERQGKMRESRADVAAGPSTSQSRDSGRSVVRRGSGPRRSLSTPPAHTTIVPRGDPPPEPRPVRYFAIWAAEVVYSTSYAARLAFDDAVEDGRTPELLTTDDFEMALAYAAGETL
ncbi:hypothetical protein C8R43DRAFT_960460 [Mycena crocata]|nr:hypothetical protein C8R43DRAFT_960460 [Mycena crocata]